MKNRNMKTVKAVCAVLALVCLLAFCVGCGEKTREEGGLDLLNMNLSPYIELVRYKGVAHTLEVPSVTDAEVQEAFNSFTSTLTTFEDYSLSPVSRPTMENDYIQLRYVGKLDGEVFDDGSVESMFMLLSKDNGYFDWLNEALYDVMPGETVTATGNMPDHENYGELAGREVVYELTLEAILRHYTFAELTEDLLLEKTGCRTEEEYREKLRSELDQAKKEIAQEGIYQTLWDKVLEESKVLKYPQKHVKYYFDSYYGYYEYLAAENGYPVATILAQAGKTVEDIQKAAEESAKEDLVYYAIVQEQKLSVTDEEYAERIEGYAKEQDMSAEELEETYGKDYIVDCMLYDEMLTFLFENAQITYTYKE